ncbi:MAG: hypothetical protein QM731_24325 [Chitinophagaceae bacterium]
METELFLRLLIALPEVIPYRHLYACVVLIVFHEHRFITLLRIGYTNAKLETAHSSFRVIRLKLPF